ncbi:MAG: prefoldin subunit alpha [Candidatus Micrarchaeota archaeon]|nr:prefoldin subunit alpha [Candidatus Micrarchaeota archaeon]
MAEEESIESLSYQIQFQQAKGDAIKKQLQDLQSALVEMGGAIETLKNIKKIKGESLLPIGSGVFISYGKPNTERVLINIGANVLSSKTPEEAVKMLEERQNNVRNAINTAQKDLNEVIASIEELSRRVAELQPPSAGATNVQPSQEQTG